MPYSDCLLALRKRFDAYQTAAFRVRAYQTAQQDARERKAVAEGALSAFLRQYGLREEAYQKAIQSADDDHRLHDALRERLEEAKRKLSEFLQEHPAAEELPPESDEPGPALDVLQRAEASVQQEAEQIQEELRDLRQAYDSVCRSVEEIPELQDRCAKLEEELEQDRERVRLLDKTMLLLERAKDRLATRYVGQLEQNFRRYADRLFEGKLGEAMVDHELRLSIDERGQQRALGSFSKGTVESVVLCMRMALVDALFTNEQPFLLLDDPFVNLDDARAGRALELIRELAKERQVIYLVCSRSRCQI